MSKDKRESGSPRFPSGGIPAVLELLDQPIVDRSRIHSGKFQQIFFQTPTHTWSSELDRILSRSDSNVEMAGCLPNPRQLEVKRIDLTFFTDSLAALDDVVESSSIELFIGSKPYTRMPVAQMGFGAPVEAEWPQDFKVAVAEAAESQRQAVACRLLRWRSYVLDQAVRIAPMQIFYVKLESLKGFVRTMDVQVSIGPTLYREIQ